MTDAELRLAIDQAWTHTQKTGPGASLDEAWRQLSALREEQRKRATQPAAPARPKPPTTEYAFGGSGYRPKGRDPEAPPRSR